VIGLPGALGQQAKERSRNETRQREGLRLRRVRDGRRLAQFGITEANTWAQAKGHIDDASLSLARKIFQNADPVRFFGQSSCGKGWCETRVDAALMLKGLRALANKHYPFAKTEIPSNQKSQTRSLTARGAATRARIVDAATI
jgi:hypothetical protein